ncbi:MAG: ThuA domain-containing protein [Acidobacteriota bacterium]|nr:MAG: ThuA domain-containing protein [Acidobacteriota bacterium]
MWHSLRFSATVLLGAMLAVSAGFSEPRDHLFKEGSLRALIFSGWNNHDWRSITTLLVSALTNTGRFDVRVTEEPAGSSDETFRPYDVIIMNYVGPRLGKQTEDALVDFVRSGKGLVLVHGASYAFSEMEILGDNHRGTGMREEPWEDFLILSGGIWTESNPKTGHGKYHSFPVEIRDKDHPVTRGMPSSFVTTDELYHDLKMTTDVRILATAFSSLESGGTGEDEPLLWTVSYGSGRVFQTLLGHSPESVQMPGFIETFVRGSEWAATGEVQSPPRSGIEEEPNQ